MGSVEQQSDPQAWLQLSAPRSAPSSATPPTEDYVDISVEMDWLHSFQEKMGMDGNISDGGGFYGISDPSFAPPNVNQLEVPNFNYDMELPFNADMSPWSMDLASTSLSASTSNHFQTAPFSVDGNQPTMVEKASASAVSVSHALQREPSSSSINIRRASPPSSRPFTCDVAECTKAYKRIHELRRHKRTHLTLKPWVCRYSLCNKSGGNGFVRKDHLRQHLRQVHQTSLL